MKKVLAPLVIFASIPLGWIILSKDEAPQTRVAPVTQSERQPVEPVAQPERQPVAEAPVEVEEEVAAQKQPVVEDTITAKDKVAALPVDLTSETEKELIKIITGSCPKADQTFGTGTETDPYLICRVEHLEWINTLPSTKGLWFQLKNSIRLRGSKDQNWIETFEGHLIGNKHRISGLRLHCPAGRLCGPMGLIGKLSPEGSIQDLTLVVTEVWALREWTAKPMLEPAGALVGLSYGHISNVSIEPSETGGQVNGNLRVGGIVGHNLGTLSNATNRGVSVNGISAVGGIVGELGNKGLIKSTETLRDVPVQGKSDVGGLVGRLLAGLLSESTSRSAVYGTLENTGTLIGHAVAGEARDLITSGRVAYGARCSGHWVGRKNRAHHLLSLAKADATSGAENIARQRIGCLEQPLALK